MSRSCAARLSVYAAIAALASGFPLAAQAPANTPPPAPPAASQPGRPPAPDAVRLREAMKPFLPAVGKWRGEGWMQMGPGEPQRAVSEETVEMRLDGLVLVVEGLHHAKLADGAAGKVVHHALAIVGTGNLDRSRRGREIVVDLAGGELLVGHDHQCLRGLDQAGAGDGIVAIDLQHQPIAVGGIAARRQGQPLARDVVARETQQLGDRIDDRRFERDAQLLVDIGFVNTEQFERTRILIRWHRNIIGRR